MLAAIRTFAKSWVAALLMGVLMLSFMFFGVHDVFHPKFSDAVVTAGSHEVSPAEFKRYFAIMAQRWSQQNNQELSIPDAVAGGFDQQVLTAVEGRAALSEYMQRIGVRPSDHLVNVEINEDPAFINSLGEFDQTMFDTAVQAAGLTAQQEKDSTRDDLAAKQLMTGMGAGLQTPMIYGALFANLNLESRNVSLLVLDPSSQTPPAAPTDAQLQALIDQQKLTRPEMRTLSIVRFSAKALAPNMPVDQAKVQALYQATKATLEQPEKRTLVEFVTRDAGKAAAIAGKLKAGQSPDAIAKALGVQSIAYDDKPKVSIADPAVADAAFSAQSGQVVGPIASALAGFAVVQVTKVTPAVTPTLEQLRAQLEAQVKTNAAIQQVFDAVKKYEDAHNGGANLADSARAAGTTPIAVGPISAQGQQLTGQAPASVSAKLLKEAFSLTQGGESEMEDEGEGEYFAVRVEQIQPPAPWTVAEVRPQLTKVYMQQAILQQLSAKADAVIQSVKKGQSFQAAAAAAKAKTGVMSNITREGLLQSRKVPPAIVELLFDAKQGDVVEQKVGPVQIMVARIDSVRPAAGADVARETAAFAQQFNQQILDDMFEAAEARAVSSTRPTGDLTAARQALGVAPEDVAKSGAPPKRGPAL